LAADAAKITSALCKVFESLFARIDWLNNLGLHMLKSCLRVHGSEGSDVRGVHENSRRDRSAQAVDVWLASLRTAAQVSASMFSLSHSRTQLTTG